ncbi:MAG: HEAT repeat domain-containing protein [Deltaproteobacteria bacterium]
MDRKDMDLEALAAAVERIGFLEWRLDQMAARLESEREAVNAQRRLVADSTRREAESAEKIRGLTTRLAEARAESARLSDRAAQAEKTLREVERRGSAEATQDRVAEAYARLLATRQKDDADGEALTRAQARIDRMERQQERFFERLVRWQHAVAAGDRDAIDLASLIAELRNETLKLSADRTATEATNRALRHALADAGVEPPQAVVPTTPSTPPSTPRWLEAPPVAPSETGLSAADARAALETIEGSLSRAQASACFEALLDGTAERAAGAVEALMSSAHEAAAPALAFVLRSSADFDTRDACLRGLGTLPGPVAEQALLAARADADWRIRAASMEAGLARMDARTTRRAQGPSARTSALDGRDFEANGAGASANGAGSVNGAGFAEADDPAMLLRAALADADPRVRRRAVLAASGTSSFDPVGVLLGAMDDEDAGTRRAIATAIGTRGDERALLTLTRQLMDEDHAVRVGVARALSRRLGVTLNGVAEADAATRRKMAQSLRAQLCARLAPAEGAAERNTQWRT